MDETVNQTDETQAGQTVDVSRVLTRDDDQTQMLITEIDRLRESLALSRAELAQVRVQQETREERLAELSAVERDRDNLARILARHLSRPQAGAMDIGGVRGWLARRLLGSAIAPRVDDADPLVAMIEASPLFDAGWYLRTYPDVAEAGERPAVHYLYHGGPEGRSPGPRFDTAFYCARYPDVREGGMNPLVHYIQCGEAEGRLPMQPAFAAVAGRASTSSGAAGQ